MEEVYTPSVSYKLSEICQNLDASNYYLVSRYI